MHVTNGTGHTIACGYIVADGNFVYRPTALVVSGAKTGDGLQKVGELLLPRVNIQTQTYISKAVDLQ